MMDDYEKDYTRQRRFQQAKEQLDRLTTRETEIIPGISRLLTVREIQVIFMMSYRTALRLIDREFKPMGGTVRVGRRLYTHAWALSRYTGMVGKCPSCGRPWDDSIDGGN